MSSLKISKKHHKHLNNPFPGAPISLPLIQGKLLFNSSLIPQRFPIGNDFEVSWNSSEGGSLSISHRSQPNRSIWSTIPGQAFVSAAVAQTRVEESRGSFVIHDTSVDLVCHHQTIQDITQFDHASSSSSYSQGTQFPLVLVTGWVFNTGPSTCTCAKYWVLFEQKCSHQIGFQVKLGTPNFEFPFRTRLRWVWSFTRPREAQQFKEFNRVCLTYSSEETERFYGFGEQFSYMDFKGKRVPILVQEQGIGRGDQPITFAANLISYRAGGDWSTTYAPSPFYMTSKMKSLYLEGYNYCAFDLTQHDRVQIQIHKNSVEGRILHGNSPTELIECFTETIGRPPKLPDWIISGAVVGMQGGTESVRRIWNELKSYNAPVSAFWLQDWVGQRETLVGSQLWWNWEVDSTRYTGWKQLIKELSAQHIKVMTYCNPCLVPCHEKPNRRRNLFEEAKKLNILVKDKQGEPYMVPNTAFDVGMLDLTHPDTGNWFKQILQEMVDDGVRGWMADFGEGLPVDATLYSGEDPISAHNKYPELWAQLNREFVEEWKANRVGKEKDPQETLVFFMRAGFRDSPRWGMLFWEGDQMVSWQIHDGIKSAVVGLLSSGMSGYAFNHSDIGGYCAVNLPFIKYQRSEELLLRWMELNAFTTVFRTHEGNKPSCNSQFYSNERTLAHFARFAKVYKAWKFYRIQLVKEATHRGLPVCRHLFLHYPNDEHVHNLSYQQFLIGTEILVVPVLDKGMNNVKAYFPTGNSSWQHVWTGKQFTEEGFETIVEAQIGYPAVFFKTGSIVGETFLKNLRDLKIL
ncbi:PREDICTED: putative alpha-xylosidase 2 [Fragaria vesca subsp. vesca]|uniref:putative alpha-xylosidase 2 n=1 Tax=Fragaria vesca subsp. vesca TaxID=101020 RepID=UPI0002C34230|nr:PREDICTED: putative alpha-xylosidase 2 [Fragaria vesca subsp. vesca]XP_011467316.1 PREDICTED: putative alpha-xylosidase 2 [Fragaria vesca subsp. vesca]